MHGAPHFMLLPGLSWQWSAVSHVIHTEPKATDCAEESRSTYKFDAFALAEIVSKEGTRCGRVAARSLQE